MNREIEIQTKRILKIVNQAVKKLKILSKLPILFELSDVKQFLTKYFLPNEIDIILGVRDYSYFSSTMSINEKVCLNNKIKKLTDDKTDFLMNQIIEIIFNSKSFINDLDKIEYEEGDGDTIEFIKEIENLNKLMKDKLLLISGEDEENLREEKLRDAYRTDLITTEHIIEIETELKKHRDELGKEEEKKREIVEKLKLKREEVNEKFQQNLNDLLLKSEKKMMLDTVSSEAKQEELNFEVNNLLKQYEMQLDEHLSTEKSLRAKRLKIETQLAGWISKYDQDVGDRQIEYEQLEQQYNKDKQEFDNFQDKVDEQDEIYEKLMQEKDEENRKIFNDKLIKFLSNRAAKIIQRAWKVYKEKKKKKKAIKNKGKGKSKGKSSIIGDGKSSKKQNLKSKK